MVKVGNQQHGYYKRINSVPADDNQSKLQEAKNRETKNLNINFRGQRFKAQKKIPISKTHMNLTGSLVISGTILTKIQLKQNNVWST